MHRLRLPFPLLDEIVKGRVDAPDHTAVILELIVEALTAREKTRGRG